MGESAQLNFVPKKIGRNFADLGEFPPNQQIFGWDIGRNSPKSKKKSPTNFEAKLNCADSPVFGLTRITVHSTLPMETFLEMNLRNRTMPVNGNHGNE
jgi:hypothetical protein